MDKARAWRLFLNTGNVEAYLMYRELVRQEFSKELGAPEDKAFEKPAPLDEKQPSAR